MTNLAFLFPGQGSQSVGMLGDAHDNWPTVAETFQEASDALGFDLWALAADGPAEAQSLTANTQPLILTASVALFRVWRELNGASPSVVAGHSLGEFSALVAADSLKFDDAVRLVRLRGEAMQESVPVGEGAMAAIIGLDDQTINEVCATINREPNHQVLAVNFNSPGQVVIAGHSDAVDEAIGALKEQGAKRALPLPVSAPFHTPLMRRAGQVLESALDSMTVADPSIPVVSNVNAQPQTRGVEIRQLLVEQIASPVQWTHSVQTMIDNGSEQFVECGPGKVLSGLVRRINKVVSCHSVETPDAMSATLEALGQ